MPSENVYLLSIGVVFRYFNDIRINGRKNPISERLSLEQGRPNKTDSYTRLNIKSSGMKCLDFMYLKILSTRGGSVFGCVSFSV